MVAKVQFDDRDYRWTYGRRPGGQGLWWFFAGEGDSFWHHGLFTEARRAASVWAKERGYSLVRVGT